jgi:signal transduction histidine kinase
MLRGNITRRFSGARFVSMFRDMVPGKEDSESGPAWRPVDSRAPHDIVASAPAGPVVRDRARVLISAPGALPRGEVGALLAAGAASDKLAALVHELSSLLDGSLRQLALLSRALEGVMARADASGDERADVRRRLRTIGAAMDEMTRAVGALVPLRARRRSGLVGASTRWGHGPAEALGEALRCGVEIVEPRASEAGVPIELRIDALVEAVAAPGIYGVVVNALRNALDSIERARSAGRPEAGRVRVEAALVERAGAKACELRIVDDGAGVERATDGLGVPLDLFAPGATTKAEHLGLGLALAREIVAQLGGRVELIDHATQLGDIGAVSGTSSGTSSGTANDTSGAPSTAGVGATLRAVWPLTPDGAAGRATTGDRA